MAIKQMDRAFLGRSEPPEDLRVVKARGSTVVDSRGKEYIDFFAGWCVGNLGWGHREIRARLRGFRGPDYVAPSFQYGPWGEVAALLAELSPGKLKVSFRATGGTEAIEIALQASIIVTGRHKFASIEGSYHGNSIAARSVGSSEQLGLLTGCHKVAPPLDRDALGRVETILSKRETAAFVMEPIICNLGVMVPSDEFMVGLHHLCRRYGTLLVMDEVACGFGRTGKMFASEHFAIQPDIMCLAKALTGGHAPMGATIVTSEVAKALGKDFDLYSTYGWHPLSVEAAIANLRYLKQHRAALMRNVADRSAEIEARLHEMEFRSTATIRAKGLAIGVELEDEDYADSIAEKARAGGLLISSEEGVIQIFPAINIKRSAVKKGLDILERSL